MALNNNNPERRVAAAVASPRSMKLDESRQVTLRRGTGGFGFTLSTNNEQYYRGINHFISSVVSGGPAAVGGLRVGDRVVQIGAQQVRC
jgi:C-terminal processing protease CtpA/Prc